MRLPLASLVLAIGKCGVPEAVFLGVRGASSGPGAAGGAAEQLPSVRQKTRRKRE